jgi:hypothetical protein
MVEHAFDAGRLQEHAAGFAKGLFRQRFGDIIQRLMQSDLYQAGPDLPAPGTGAAGAAGLSALVTADDEKL